MGRAEQGVAVLIAGPTASGKSALALALAERLGGIVINADSMQVYRDLKIITARPDAAAEARAPHRLYGHVDAAENYSVGRFLQDAGRSPRRGAAARPAIAIFTGGTGLYFKALTAGLAAIPPVPATIRAAVRARLDAQGAPALHAELARRDPATAQRLRPADRPRVARALEVAGGDRPLDRGLAPRRRWPPLSARRDVAGFSSRQTAPRSTAGSMRASMPCWRRARSRRCGRWRRGASIRCCRR